MDSASMHSSTVKSSNRDACHIEFDNEGNSCSSNLLTYDRFMELNEHVSSMQSQQDSCILDGSTATDSAKRKLEDAAIGQSVKRIKGTAPIKAQYLVNVRLDQLIQSDHDPRVNDDDAEAFHHDDRGNDRSANGSKPSKKGRREKAKGQNKGRRFDAANDERGLCGTRMHAPEFGAKDCPFGDKCKFDHDLRHYLKTGKRGDIVNTEFKGQCPVYTVRGVCRSGWSCRFATSHSAEVEREDGKKELILTKGIGHDATKPDSAELGVGNDVPVEEKVKLSRRKFPTPKADQYLPYLEMIQTKPGQQRDYDKDKRKQERNGHANKTENGSTLRNSSSPEPEGIHHSRAGYVEPPFLPSEKRRLYFGPDTPVLAPLTTQGNLPFRKLCMDLGASLTYSEMAMGMQLLEGKKAEWALLKAHEAELQPPSLIGQNDLFPANYKSPKTNVVFDYNHSQDLSYGAQIQANKPWLALKTVEVLSTLLPNGFRCIDLNCGCPIDLVYQSGGGSALMDSPSKLDKMLRGMNAVSGETPITCKIRTGTRKDVNTAGKLVERLVLGQYRGYGQERDAACGVAAITLHGRSRQQRYTREADWEYISEVSNLIQNLNIQSDADADTIRETDARDQANGHKSTPNKVFFLGNGDVYSHEDYYEHLNQAKVDAVMIGRGAIIKPWIFEEIKAGQSLDKSSSERLSYIASFTRTALSTWGSDTHGISTTRRFLLEYLSFAHRYVPIGILEHLPPKINDRPPRYQGRDELETLMASDSYRDWIKLTEIFLGKTQEAEGVSMEETGWVPKHKSHAWEGEGQG